MAINWSSIRIAQVIGLGGAAWLSGNIASLSLITIPTLLNSQALSPTQISSSPSSKPSSQPLITPHQLTQQWRQTYELGKSQNRPISLVIASSFLFLAYKARSAPLPIPRTINPSPVFLYVVAAVLTMGIAPYTGLVMSGVNGQLIELSEGKGAIDVDVKGKREKVKEVKGLLERWQSLNAVRSMLPLLGGLVGVAAVLI